MTDQPLSGLVALVTGASRGIGRACAIGLAQAGAHVIATARTQGALEALDDEIKALTGRDTTLVPLDLKTGDDIDRLGAAVFERWGKLDILVSAAGELGVLTPVAHLDPAVWERAVREYIGTGGTLHAIRGFRMKAFNTAGMTVTVRGKVERKWIDTHAAEGQRHRLDLRVWSTNGDGISVGPGVVVASLPE